MCLQKKISGNMQTRGVLTDRQSPSTWLTIGASRRAGRGILTITFLSSKDFRASYSIFTTVSLRETDGQQLTIKMTTREIDIRKKIEERHGIYMPKF
jgi:hypothetical protein